MDALHPFTPPAVSEHATVIEHELSAVVQGRPALDVPAISAAMIRAVRNVTRPGVAGYAVGIGLRYMLPAWIPTGSPCRSAAT